MRGLAERYGWDLGRRHYSRQRVSVYMKLVCRVTGATLRVRVSDHPPCDAARGMYRIERGRSWSPGDLICEMYRRRARRGGMASDW